MVFLGVHIADPHDPAIDKWLRSLEPRQELMLRFAIRRRFADVRADPKFGARVDELRQRFDEDRLEPILADANLVAEQIEDILGQIPAETKTKFYRERACVFRQAAEQETLSILKEALLSAAEIYDRLARVKERDLSRGPQRTAKMGGAA
jgi:hypothetical protein